MAIKGSIFDNQVPTAKQFGAAFAPILFDGILQGCEVSYSGSDAHVQAGTIIVCGRVFELTAEETVALSGTGFARIVIDVDLSRDATAEIFEQVELNAETAASEAAFLPLETENINLSGTHYQVELARFSIASDAITGIISTLGSVVVKAVPNHLVIDGVDYALHKGSYAAGAAGEIRFSTT